MGDGVFIRALDSALARTIGRPSVQVTAFEIDSALVSNAIRPSSRLQVFCRHEDFITAKISDLFDGAVANPPYVRHHALKQTESVLRQFDRMCGRRISRMTNLYGLFLLRIWSLLAARGRAAVITPAEWLNADFGVPIKTHLLEQNALDGIVHFDHASNVFAGALTTAAIILLRRGRGIKEPIRLASVSGVRQLSKLKIQDARGIGRTALDPKCKWSPLFERGSPRSTKGPKLQEIATCSRGIATGANAYFVLRESKRLAWGIDRRDLRLCISKARQITGDRLRAVEMRHLVERDEPVWLLSPRRRLSAAVTQYLAEGRRLGIDLRYLPSHRPTWFRPEVREPAPILVSVFARGAFRFVRNEARVLNLTAYHGIYPRSPRAADVRSLHKYLCSRSARDALRRHRRIYGAGLSKLEPRDVEALEIPESLSSELT